MSKEELLAQVNRALRNCKKCRLSRTRTNVVPGDGSPNAEIMFVGQCPGFHEDQQGIPFVGRAGQLLDELLASIDLKREKIFITNIVKCRPPENRDPMVDEVRNCSPYLERQIKIFNPKLIITLGRFASEFFIPNGKISQIHGVPHRVKGRLVFPLYHPAAALRSTGVLEELRRDFRKIPEVLAGEMEVKEIVNNNVSENQMSLI
jgi:uracil-DNA glycosylase family 4